MAHTNQTAERWPIVVALAILLSANAPARAQLDFATQTDTRYSPSWSGGWVQAAPVAGPYAAGPTAGDTAYASTGVSDFAAAAAPVVPTRNSFFPSAGKQSPHPSVVRVIAAEPGGASLGSGTLVDANGENGLVITNWHVVREAPGSVMVVFPDGFQSMGRVLRMDSNWDLAAILIKKPQAAPVPVAREAPRLGEMLTIAGYGSGSYRAASGACTQYLAPSTHHPYELVELAASARQGDSGGPIFNSRGELAGVLFGEGGGRTTGAYCGRVHNFLTLAVQQLHQQNGTMLAAGPDAATKDQQSGGYTGAANRNTSSPNEGWRARTTGPSAAAVASTQAAGLGRHTILDTAWGEYAVPISTDAALPASFYATAPQPADSINSAAGAAPRAAIAPTAMARGSEASAQAVTKRGDQPVTSAAEHFLPQGSAAASSGANAAGQDPSTDWIAAEEAGSLSWQLFAGQTLVAQLKTVLAGVGVVALLFHGTRTLARTSTANKPPAKRKGKS